jgi:alpha-galactosidase
MRAEYKILFRAGENLLERIISPGSSLVNEYFKLEEQFVLNPDLSADFRLVLIPLQPLQLLSFEAIRILEVSKIKGKLINGYQSWTHSRVASVTESMETVSRTFYRFLNASGDYSIFSAPKRKGLLHSHWYTYFEFEDDTVEFWGSLDENSAFTIFQTDFSTGKFRIIRDVRGKTISESYKLLHIRIIEGPLESVTERFLGKIKPVPPVHGWTSWYNYYTNIDEKIILHSIDAYRSVAPAGGIFQIDDGWQPAVGDWDTMNGKFPKGLAELTQKIKSANHKAGLWFAPFVCECKSGIYKNHPEWILKNSAGKFQIAGFNPLWGGMSHPAFYSINILHPGFREYLSNVFEKIYTDWGFDMIKPDFLYAACMIPHGGKTRAELMNEGMALLRSYSEDKLILGCGVPLSAALDYTDFCRIGPDIGLNWETRWMEDLHLRERVSTKNGIDNSMYRYMLSNRALRNDTDVYILRNSNVKLSPNQKNTLYISNQIFGDLLFHSDDVSEYDTSTKDLFLSQFPQYPRENIRFNQVEEIREIRFSIREVHYLVYMNTGAKAQVLYLKENCGHTTGILKKGESIHIEAYQTILLTLPGLSSGFIWSSGHLFPGCEINIMKKDNSGWNLTDSVRPTTVLLLDEERKEEILINGKSYASVTENDFRIVRINL